MAKPWFRPKQQGFGFAPSSWEGVLVTGLYVAGVVAALRFGPGLVRDPRLGVIIAVGLLIVLTAAFLLICARTMQGEMRWRWGRD